MRVPWLDTFWERASEAGYAVFLTGSLLTEACRPTKQTALATIISDVDLFVERSEHLEAVVAILRECLLMSDDGQSLQEQWCSANKLRILCNTGGPGGAVDLYSHPLERISRYHLSQVRAAFDGHNFYCTASSAVALATRFNPDFDMAHRKERAVIVLSRKWLSGASLLVNRAELTEFLRWIRQTSKISIDASTQRILEHYTNHAVVSSNALRLRSAFALGGVEMRYRQWR